MMDPQTIKSLLQEGMTAAHVDVAGDGRHFQALIVSSDFEGQSLIKRHRMVYSILQDHIDSELLHAISMRTLTPAQWSAERET